MMPDYLSDYMLNSKKSSGSLNRTVGNRMVVAIQSYIKCTFSSVPTEQKSTACPFALLEY